MIWRNHSCQPTSALNMAINFHGDMGELSLRNLASRGGSEADFLLEDFSFLVAGLVISWIVPLDFCLDGSLLGLVFDPGPSSVSLSVIRIDCDSGSAGSSGPGEADGEIEVGMLLPSLAKSDPCWGTIEL
ncbi:hypothetical protein WICPIJ_004777 [Wickerhamomyces pijperi]|uniref:Uncharacterized protein n=1 Tax=Wickerhamomyces pijperi TaxID=599730 RepID=A0A9P8Q4S8_WICPI|nr:hypothetical protein WICPIJ_004777 [Wickerhamomyces pijperi]